MIIIGAKAARLTFGKPNHCDVCGRDDVTVVIEKDYGVRCPACRMEREPEPPCDDPQCDHIRPLPVTARRAWGHFNYRLHYKTDPARMEWGKRLQRSMDEALLEQLAALTPRYDFSQIGAAAYLWSLQERRKAVWQSLMNAMPRMTRLIGQDPQYQSDVQKAIQFGEWLGVTREITISKEEALKRWPKPESNMVAIYHEDPPPPRICTLCHQPIKEGYCRCV